MFNYNYEIRSPVQQVQQHPVLPSSGLHETFYPVGCVGRWTLVKFKDQPQGSGKVWPMIIKDSDPFGMTTAQIPPSMELATFPSNAIDKSICL